MASSHRELLTGHPVARAADVDEAHDAVTRLYLPHRLEVLERDTALNMTLNAVRMGAVTVGYFRYGGAVRMVTADAGNYHVNVPVAGQCEQQCGSLEPVLASTNRTAAVFMPGYPADLRWQADSAQLCLMIDRHELEFELERQIGQPLAKPLQFTTAMDLSTAAAQSWLAVLELLEREIDRPGGIAHHPLAKARLQMLVIAGLLLAQPHNYSDLVSAPARPAAPRAVRRAVELMESEPSRPWSSGALAQEVAVSVRALQEGFRRSFGLPPMVYLREVRLNRVHDELLSAAPDDVTVSVVAGRWGFLHHGRFAEAYRRKFGCSPSATLRS
ncbi:AraC family transcriptional regulator [Kribbella alba]|uniref:AraC family transcriptional regulator n=1 Tax=Kribbella alba TaxID=190197 RepID=A0ABN2FCI0_9ACTN